MGRLSTIKDTAARWVARRSGDNWTPTDEAELSQWLNASTGHLIEFMRLEAAWREADRLKALGAGFERGVISDPKDLRASPFFRHANKQVPTAEALRTSESVDAGTFKPIRWAIAASALLAVAVLMWSRGFFAGNVYSTPTGVTAAVPLSDGSKITLNTDSQIRVAVTDEERHVELEQGEAFFEVVRDPMRPFTVGAGDKRIVVLGTKFSVRRDKNAIGVIVTEGKVMVDGVSVLAAGSVASAKDGNMAVRRRTLPEVEELLSWRSGYVVFHETSLADAVAEFNRYNGLKFVIEDPAVAAMSVSGNFRSTNVDSFVRLLEQGFPVIVDRQGNRLVLTKRQSL